MYGSEARGWMSLAKFSGGIAKVKKKKTQKA
jgi:hypothetical protein